MFPSENVMFSIKVTFSCKNCLMEYSGNFTGSSQCLNVSEHQYSSVVEEEKEDIFLFVAPHNSTLCWQHELP